jgi:uncharacterized integral membrane protein
MNIIRLILLAIVFLALLLLSLDNTETVTLNLFRYAQWQAPLILVLFCAFALGAVLGLLAGALRTARVKRELHRLQREHRKLLEGDNTPDTPPLPLPPLDMM